jgi:hypothetical protein
VLIIVLLSTLCITIVVHVYYLLMYIKIRSEAYLRKFINTAAINIVLAGTSIVLAIFAPGDLKRIEGAMIIWAMSGVMMVFIVLLQTLIFMRVHRRSKLPEHYHYNFFGKKVLHSSVATPIEIALFFASIPLFVVGGAYFVARFIRFFI